MFKQRLKIALPLLLGLALLGPLLFSPAQAKAANPATINFQGKIVNADGTNVPSSTPTNYSIVFRIYNTSSPTMTTSCTSTSSCLWEETQGSVSVLNGVFQVELGSACALTSGSCNNSAGGPINFSSNNSLYLTMQFNGDTSGSNGGFMSPLIHITSVPFALQSDNSASLGSIAAANYVQLATGNLQADSTTNNSIAVNKTGASGNILLLEASSKTALTVNNSGSVILGQAGASGLAGVLTFNNATDASTASITFTGNSTASYTYLLPSTVVSSGQCLQSGTVSGANVPLTFGSCATGGSGYATIQDEGTPLATETTVNFIGNSVACADNSGSSRTDCTVAPNLQNAYDNSGSPATIVSTSSSKNILFQSGSTFNSTGFFQIQNSSGSSGTLLNADTSNMRLGVNVTYASMTVPAGLTSTASAGTGFTAGQSYRYEVTAIDSLGGETTVSNEPTACAPASTNLQCTLAWTAVTGASGYRVYRTANGGASGSEKYLTTVLKNSYIDTNAITLSSTNPSGTNSAYTSTNTSSALGQISVGGLGSPAGQVYISGALPKDITNGGVNITNVESFYIVGRYAYVVNNAARLYVFDISNPAVPVDVSGGGLLLPGSGPSSIFVLGRYAYVTYVSSLNPGLQVYDVSKPSAPTDVSGGIINIPGNPDYVYVQGRYAYVLDGVINKLHVFDISNPAVPVDASGGGVSTGTGAKALYVQGRYAYVTDTTANKLQVFDVSNPAVPVDVSGGGVSTGASTGPFGVFVQGRYAYVTDTTANKLQVFDVSNPAVPVDVSGGGVSTGASTGPHGVYVQGRYAYVTDSTNSKLQVFDVSNPDVPVDVSGGGVSTASSPNLTIVQGRYAYVAGAGGTKFQVFDLGGEYTQQLEAGGTETGNLQVDSNGQVAGDFNVQGGLGVGSNAQFSGNFGLAGSAYVQGGVVLAGGKNQLGAPTGLTANTATSGGSLSGIYKYYVTAVDSYGGETTQSSEVTTASLGSPNQTEPLTWTAVTGAAGYKIYRTEAAGGTGTEKFLASTTTNSYSDTGAVLLEGGVAPTVDTTGQLTVKGSALFKSSTNSAAAFQVQNSSGVSIFTVDTSNGLVALGNSSLAGQLSVYNGSNAVTLKAASATASYNIILPASAGATNQCLVNTSTPGTLQWLPCGAGSTASVTLAPEFVNAVMSGDGTSNTGTMTSDFCSNGNTNPANFNTGVCTNSGDIHNYYSWTAAGTDDYDIIVRWQVPNDWASWQGTPATFFRWASSASDSVQVQVDAGGNQCGVTNYTGGGAAWSTSNISSLSGCTISAGQVVTIDIHLSVVSGEFARIGEITFNYNRN